MEEVFSSSSVQVVDDSGTAGTAGLVDSGTAG